jgi:hypothetical protein
MAESGEPVRGRLASLADAVVRQLRRRPYPVLGLAVMAGYVAGGGLFSPLTRPLARAAMGALLVPSVRERLRALADELREAQATGAA